MLYSDNITLIGKYRPFSGTALFYYSIAASDMLGDMQPWGAETSLATVYRELISATFIISSYACSQRSREQVFAHPAVWVQRVASG